jgi:hypothetical protein
MKAVTYHISNFGRFAPTGVVIDDGYVTMHDSPRYAQADGSLLEHWACSKLIKVRNAACTEIANRRVQAWRDRAWLRNQHELQG